MAKTKKKSTKTTSKKAVSKKKEKRVILGLDVQSVEELIDFFKEKGAYEFEWQKSGTKISIKLANGPIQTTSVVSSVVQDSAVATEKKAEVNSNCQKILSPFVGTFYRSPAPGSDPYVKEGQSIRSGDVLCIVEAMKLMNEIESEVSGKIVEVLVEDAQPVEFGEPLFLVEK